MLDNIVNTGYISINKVKGRRNKMNKRIEETRVVKDALAKAGYNVLTVHHGRGTSHSWLHAKVEVPKPLNCSCTINACGTVNRCITCGEQWRTHFEATNSIVRQVTGRHGEYENFGVDINLNDHMGDGENQMKLTKYVSICGGCNKEFRVSEDDLRVMIETEKTLHEEEISIQEMLDDFNLCSECQGKKSIEGEYV